MILLAPTGMRAVYALNICINYIDFINKPALIHIRAKLKQTELYF
jgi:hypothetical protein